MSSGPKSQQNVSIFAICMVDVVLDVIIQFWQFILNGYYIGGCICVSLDHNLIIKKLLIKVQKVNNSAYQKILSKICSTQNSC